MEEKKYIKKAVVILAVLIIGSVIGYKVYSKVQTRNLADQFAERIIANTEELVRKIGLSDFEIKCKDNQYAAFANEFGKYEVEMDRYCYYYHLDLYSDQIADLYETKLKNQKQDELIDIMYSIYIYANECSKYNKFGWKIIPYKDDYINAYFKHSYPEKSVFIETSTGDQYGFTVDYMEKRLYVNDEMVYEQIEEPEELPTKPDYIEPTPKPKNDYKYTGKTYDTYGVEDYDNPDDFAEEWAEEFGDGDFDDGYDDAYDYWEEEY